MARYPGAVWKPSPYHGGLRTKGRGFCAHVAVSNAHSLTPNSGASWHFYIAKDGYTEQYIDSDNQAWAQLIGNATLLCAETQGGVVAPETELWTAAQIERLADIWAWQIRLEGCPNVIMANSLTTSRGFGYHRLGIDPWRVAGGQLWSSARGKVCPGTAKIGQIPQIISRARTILGGEDLDMTPAQAVQQTYIENALYGGYPRGGDKNNFHFLDERAALRHSELLVKLDELIAAVKLGRA